MQLGILVILLCTVAYAMVAQRLSRTVITAPMIFLALGLALAYSGLIDATHTTEMLHLIAEVSLIVLLFVDASKINLQELRYHRVWPARMLLVGLPLSVGFGILFALPFFPEWPLAVIALVAAILAPTDAALGQAVVSNTAVPKMERQSLTVESGMNDGLALPLILFFACLVATHTGEFHHDTNWLWFVSKQIVLGPVAGILIGWMGAKVFLSAEVREFTAPTYEGVAVLALAGATYLVASLVGGNGFIAAFVAGLAFGNLVKGHCRFIYEFAESEGQMLVWASFLFIGLGLLPEALAHLSWEVAGYILISLFIVRPLAIYISLLGTGSRPVTRLFFGWFGPRGLATALFALIVTHGIDHHYAHSVLVIAINAVWISAVLHGITATPAAKRYGQYIHSRSAKEREKEGQCD